MGEGGEDSFSGKVKKQFGWKIIFFIQIAFTSMHSLYFLLFLGGGRNTKHAIHNVKHLHPPQTHQHTAIPFALPQYQYIHPCLTISTHVSHSCTNYPDSQYQQTLLPLPPTISIHPPFSPHFQHTQLSPSPTLSSGHCQSVRPGGQTTKLTGHIIEWTDNWSHNRVNRLIWLIGCRHAIRSSVWARSLYSWCE